MTTLIIKRPETHLGYSIKQEDFRTIAIRYHKDQKYGEYPYAIHFAMIEDCLVANGYDTYEDRACAWLHDIIEDTEMTYNRIFKLFGKDIADRVDACTGVGENRKERNASIYKKISDCPTAAHIKVADRIINTKFSYSNQNFKKLGMYVKEFEEFSTNLRPIMTETKQGALFWNHLEDITSAAILLFHEKLVAELNATR